MSAQILDHESDWEAFQASGHEYRPAVASPAQNAD